MSPVPATALADFRLRVIEHNLQVGCCSVMPV